MYKIERQTRMSLNLTNLVRFCQWECLKTLFSTRTTCQESLQVLKHQGINTVGTKNMFQYIHELNTIMSARMISKSM